MNQLQTRSTAPFVSVLPSADSTNYFPQKKINVFVDMARLVIGTWRLYWNYCPECNSCAPKIHQCEVCNADTKSHFHWNREVAQTWWKKYTDKHHLAI